MSQDFSPVEWTEDGLPRSRLYGDVYFSSQDGLAESRAVFLAGCGLPEAWAGRRRFTVGELGFGSGLNIAALLTLWRETAPTDAYLSLFSIEAHPMSAADAGRALDRWPEIAEAAAALTGTWPSEARGFHRLDLPAFRASLDLAVMEAGEALAAWDGAADAWLLDGFAPAANPAMWRQEVLDLVAARSASGARAATFTVAGAVRRGLAEAGFTVDKRPGFGRKRERLEARLPGEAPTRSALPIVAIVGAGIAGCCLAQALAREGLAAVLIDQEGLGAGASGNPAALVTPRLDAGLGPVAALFAQAFRQAVSLYDATPGAVIAQGALQLAVGERDAGRFARIAASDLFAAGDLALLDPEAASAELGEPGGPALAIRPGRVVDPAPLLAALAAGTERRQARVERLERDGTGWRLLDEAGGEIARADAVVLAAGTDSARLAPELDLRPVRGQASWTADISRPAAAFGGYAIPTREGLLFGATHDRDCEGRQAEPADDARNLATLAKGLPELAAALAGRPLTSRAAIRATTADHLPLAGALGEAGLHVLGGLGSRGFCLAPLLAAHLAAGLAGAPSPLPRGLAALVDPGRFARRAAIRATWGVKSALGRNLDTEAIMTRTLLIALSVTALAGVAGLGAAGASPASSKPSRSCFFADQVNGWRQAGDQAVLVNVGAKQVYRLDLFGPCRDLDTNLTIGLETRGGGNSICEGLDATVIAHSPIGPMRCPVTKVTKLTPEEIAALPKKDIP